MLRKCLTGAGRRSAAWSSSLAVVAACACSNATPPADTSVSTSGTTNPSETSGAVTATPPTGGPSGTTTEPANTAGPHASVAPTPTQPTPLTTDNASSSETNAAVTERSHAADSAAPSATASSDLSSSPSGEEGSTGVTFGETACGDAAEDGAVNLACPDGQVIDSVVFASYGTPTGACGNFETSDCNSASSKSMVESLCVGRRSCSVPASNAAFGDPCNKVVKKLAVEVACAVGEPTASAQEPYKGIANSPAKEIAALGATWCYNWGTQPKSTDCADPLFVPMVWGSGDVAGAIKSIGSAGYTTVLGFNEPNKSDQSNMTVQQAIALWPDLTSDPNIRVSSPAVSDDGRAWLEDFMDQVKTKGLRVDFIAMHWYGWNSGSCTAGSLEGAINWASQWGLPVWITEFGCMGSSNPDEQTVLKFYNDAVVMLQKHPLVERYAWYPWNTYNHLYDNDTMTSLGEAFAAAPQYRP